ncbi:hypothetical protein H5410_026056 [Solanum commersonii]|uniref:Uncharacterized protein n=1 Tax=Solanum commersonii TaxID=4109 RepID=A0A9J5YZQ8_SOLCO|nr:hypothetical protein H5410_026056 [Solanum commersonii]
MGHVLGVRSGLSLWLRVVSGPKPGLGVESQIEIRNKARSWEQKLGHRLGSSLVWFRAKVKRRVLVRSQEFEPHVPCCVHRRDWSLGPKLRLSVRSQVKVVNWFCDGVESLVESRVLGWGWESCSNLRSSPYIGLGFELESGPRVESRVKVGIGSGILGLRSGSDFGLGFELEPGPRVESSRSGLGVGVGSRVMFFKVGSRAPIMMFKESF